MADKKKLWNSASTAGLVLGGVSALYLLITGFTGDIPASGGFNAILIGILNAALWLVKLVACIYLMKFFMKKYSDENPKVSNNGTFRFGSLVAMLSSLVYSGFMLLDFHFIHPDIFDEALEVVAETSEMNSASIEAMEEMVGMMPNYTFFMNFFYCWLFGTILALIFSRNIPSRNPFENGPQPPMTDDNK